MVDMPPSFALVALVEEAGLLLGPGAGCIYRDCIINL